MILDSFLEKKECYQLHILHKIATHDSPISKSELREHFNLSKNSIESYLIDLKFDLSDIDNSHSMDIDHEFVAFRSTAPFDIKFIYSYYLKKSLKFLILDYALSHPNFSVTSITQNLSISESTLFRKIKELNLLLKEFNIKLKNGILYGEELQIRYFYFQLYWYVTPHSDLKVNNNSNNIQKIVTALENSLKISFSDFNHSRMNLWLVISKKRLKIKNSDYHLTTEKMLPYKEDLLYKKIKHLTLFFISHFAFEIKEEESMLHFIFLTSMSLLPETYFSEYDLIRNRRGPITLADTWARETILLSYQPQKTTLDLERQINYFISQINSRLFFFEGALIPPFQHYEANNRDNYIDQSPEKMIDNLLKHILRVFDKSISNHNSEFEQAATDYKQLLTLIDMKISQPVSIGLHLWLPALNSELIYHSLLTKLEKINGITVRPYNKKESYDIILTNTNLTNYYDGNPIIYVATDWSLPIHIKMIHKLIHDVQFQK